MERDSFIFYRSFYDAIRELPRDIQGEVYTAIMEYSLYGITIENLKPITRSIFTLIKPQLDANLTRYENGRKGGAPKGVSNNPNGRKGGKELTENKPRTNQELTKNKPKTNQELTENKPNANVNVNDNENVNDNYNYNFSFEFCDSEFSKILLDWVDYKKKSNCPIRTQTQIEAAYRQLYQFCGDDAAKARETIDYSISGGYANIYTRINFENSKTKKVAPKKAESLKNKIYDDEESF